MIQTKITQTLAPAGLVPAGKLGHSFCSLLLVLTLCVANAAWSQTVPGFRGGRIPRNVVRGVQPATPAVPTPASAQYQFISIEIPGATGTGPGLPGAFAYGINNAGAVTGFYNDASNVPNGFVWRNGTLHTLDNPSSPYTALGAVNNRGVAMGYYGDLTVVHAAMYSFATGAWTTLPDILNMPNNEGFGINKFGVAVGIAEGGDFNSYTNPISWIWNPSSQSYTFFAVPGSTQYSTIANAINDKGQIIGSFSDTNGGHGFLKDGDTYTTLDVPGTTGTTPLGINNSGIIAGEWFNLSGWQEGFVRTSAGVYSTVDFPGALETVIGGINDRGDICGYWADPNTGFWTPFVGFKQ